MNHCCPRKQWPLYSIVVLGCVAVVVVVLYVLTRRFIRKKKEDMVQQLCDFVELSASVLESSLMDAFAPGQPTGDVFMTIYGTTFLLIPKDVLTQDVHALDILPEFTSNSTISIVNTESTWDHLLFSTVDPGVPYTDFRILGTSDKFVVGAYQGFPVCSNIWARIHDVVISRFTMDRFSRTLQVTSPQPPVCLQTGEYDLHIDWDVDIENHPVVVGNLNAGVEIVSGYCGADVFGGRCLHDMRHSPCPNDKMHIDQGSVFCQATIQTSATFHPRISFDLTVNPMTRTITLHGFVISLKEWSIENTVEFVVSHTGFSVIKVFQPIGDLIDTTPLQEALTKNVDSFFAKWVPAIFEQIQDAVGDLELSIPFP